jgi:hypothetical protein
MGFKVATSTISLLAEGASVVLLAAVRGHVVVVVARLVEALAARGAAEWEGARVRLDVAAQAVAAREPLRGECRGQADQIRPEGGQPPGGR